MKKFFSLALMALTSAALFAQTDVGAEADVSGALDFTANGITYTIIDDINKTCITKAGESIIVDRKYIVTYGNDITGDITIPAQVSNGDDTYTVTAIGSYGFGKVSSVTIEEGVSTINTNAFSVNSNLTSISIPSSVTSILKGAFSGCVNLAEITLPSSLQAISPYILAECTSLKSIVIPEGVTYIGDNAFSNCSALQSVTIPNSVLQIGAFAFQSCSNLTEVQLPENLSSVATSAFAGCSKITTLSLPASLSSIGEGGFNCAGLKELICYSKNVPAISYKSFNSSNYKNTVLKVYKSAFPAYQKSTLWSNFVNMEIIPVPLEGVVLTPTTLTVNVGLSGYLSAALTPSESVGDISWSIKDMSVDGCVSVDDNGKVIGRKIGTATVVASCGDFSAECNVVVTPNSSERVTISPLTQNIYAGDVAQLTATVFPPAITPSFTWSSSNPAVATVDEATGELTAIAPGATVISATTDNVTGKLPVNVLEVLPESVTISQTSLEMEVGDSYSLEASVSPSNVTYPTVTWETSDPNIVVVADGMVQAMGVGSATVRAMCGGVTANCVVTVNPTPAEEVILSQSSATLRATQTLQLTALVMPVNTTDKTIVWTSSDDTVATVSEEGVVTAFKVGTAVITATCGTVSSNCDITVESTPSEGVILNTVAITLRVDQVQQLAATVLPETTTDKDVTWSSSDAAIATVDNGLVSAIAPGIAVITAANGTSNATCVVTVEEIPVEQVIIDPASVTVNVGQNAMLSAIVLPTEIKNPVIEWTSSNPEVAMVINGNVSGLSPGSAVITAVCGMAFSTSNVTVVQPATSITLNETSVELEVGDYFDLIETVTPANTTDFVEWTSSNPDVATVDSNGIIYAIKAGSTVITATCGNVKVSCEVTVNDIAAESITLDSTELNLLEGQISRLTATVMPEDVTNPTVVWTSSNEKVATVAADGTVTAVAAGTATITASCGEVSATCAVTVTKPAEDQFYLNQTSATLKVSETVELSATYVSTSSSNYEITWSTSNPSVATVSTSGLVIATGIGEATVTATCNGKTAVCEITVEPTPAEYIDLSASEVTLKINDTYSLEATVYPATTTDPAVIWTTSNENVVKVNNGTIEAVSEGSAVVTASCGEVFANCVVNVIKENSDEPGSGGDSGGDSGEGDSNGIEDIEFDADVNGYCVYDISGAIIMKTMEKSDLNKLAGGVYIINGKKILIRK